MSRSIIFLTFAAALVTTASAACAGPRLVRRGDDLQAAIDRASPGDELRLEAGATFTGNFILPFKDGASVITLRSDVPDTPGPGERVTSAAAARFAKIVSPNNTPALRTSARAHHWRIAYLEFPATREGYGDIIAIGDGSAAQSDAAAAAHDIALDHLYIHGDPLLGQKRGIALNGAAVTVTNCYVSDIKAAGADAQAIGGWNGPGPFSIENNYLEATGEGFLLGGSDPAIPNLVPHDLVFRFNYVARPMQWREPIVAPPAHVKASSAAGAGTLPAGTYAYRIVARRPVGQGTIGHSLPSASAEVTSDGGAVTLNWDAVADATDYQVFGRSPSGATEYWTVTATSFTDKGTPGTDGSPPKDATLWQVKNLFELKNARHAIVDSNVFENNWLNAQPGYAIVLTPRNQDGHCPWCIVEQVEFTNNLVRNTAAGFNISGYDSPHASQQTRGVRVAGNLIEITKKLGGNGWGVLIGDAPRDIVFDHNTFEFDGTTLVYAYGGNKTEPKPIQGFQFTHNAAPASEYGINGADASPGAATLKRYFPDAVVGGDGGREGPGADVSRLKTLADHVVKGVVPTK